MLFGDEFFGVIFAGVNVLAAWEMALQAKW
jgi:hypothetical protein